MIIGSSVNFKHAHESWWTKKCNARHNVPYFSTGCMTQNDTNIHTCMTQTYITGNLSPDRLPWCTRTCNQPLCHCPICPLMTECSAYPQGLPITWQNDQLFLTQKVSQKSLVHWSCWLHMAATRTGIPIPGSSTRHFTRVTRGPTSTQLPAVSSIWQPIAPPQYGTSVF